MRIKQYFAAALAVLLIVVNGFPVFAIAVEVLQPHGNSVTIEDRGEPSKLSEGLQKPPSDASEELPEPPPDASEELPEPPPDASEESPEPSLDSSEELPKPSLNSSEELPKPLPDSSEELPKPSPDSSEELPKPSPDSSEELPKPSPDLSEELPELPSDLPEESPDPLEKPAYPPGAEQQLPDIQDPLVKGALDKISLPDAIPTFSMEFVEEGNTPGLYGTLSGIPFEAVSIKPMYREKNMVSGEDEYLFIMDENGVEREWDMSVLDDTYGDMPITELCAGLADEPVYSYLSGSVNRMEILLSITTEEGEYRTGPVVVTREEHLSLSTACTVELLMDVDEPGLYVTLENVPEDLSEVTVLYSFGSPDYILEDRFGKTWFTYPRELENELLAQADDEGNLKFLSFGAHEHPLSAYLSETVDTLYIQVLIQAEDYANSAEFEPVRFSHENTYEIPEPPPFTADFKLGWFSYWVIGHFTDFPPNVAQVSSTYSWDGINYQYNNRDGWPMRWQLGNLGNEDATAKSRLENQECAEYYEEPLKSFLARERDFFYLRLEITTQDGEVYYSEPAYLSREGLQALPENLTPRPFMGFDMSVMEARNDNGLSEDDENYYEELVNYTYGQFQMTVRDNATWEEIKAILPDTVPVRVRFYDKDSKKQVSYGDISCAVNWKKPVSFSLVAGEPLVMEDMANPLVIPGGTEVVTDLGTYRILKPLAFQSRYNSDDIRLVINPVAAGDGPKVVLRAGEDWDGNDTMSLAFWNKPSGAASIKAYALVGEERIEICDLLDRRDIDHNQSHGLYGYVPLFQADEFPYREYINGVLDYFAVEIVIKGGVYDGKVVTLPWWEGQEYELPEEIFDPSGSEGQENDAGSDNKDDSNEEGQRPNLPLWPEPPWEPETPAPVVPSTGEGHIPKGLKAPKLPVTVPEQSIAVEVPPDVKALLAPMAEQQTNNSNPPSLDTKPERQLHGKNQSIGEQDNPQWENISPDQAKPEFLAEAPEPAWSVLPDETEARVAKEPSIQGTEPDNYRSVVIIAALAGVGGVIAVSLGVTTGGALTSGFFGKVLNVLRRLLFRR